MSTAPVESRESHPPKRHLTLDLWTTALGVVALALAILTLLLDIRLHDLATDIRHSTNDFIKAETTRYVEQFPNNIGEIIRVVNATCSNLDIMADTPGYGIYSNPAGFENYQTALHALLQRENGPTNCRAHEVPQIRMLIFPSDERNRMNSDEEFPKEMFLRQLAQDTNEQAKFISFCQQHKNLIRGYSPKQYLDRVLNHGAYDDFLSALGQAEDEAELDFSKRNNITVRHATNHYTFYAWIQDGVSAVFSFQYRPDPGKRPSFSTSEVAFRTDDPTLLASFKDIFKQEWCRAKESRPDDRQCVGYPPVHK